MIHKRDARTKCEDLVRYAETGIPSDRTEIVRYWRGLALGYIDAMFECERITIEEHRAWTTRAEKAKGF